MDCGHFSLGKVQYHTPATNISQYNYSKIPIVQRSATPEYVGCNKVSKVKRNKSSSAADTQIYRGPETRRLLSDRRLEMNRSNPNLWEYSKEHGPKVMCGRERRSGSQPSLTVPLRVALPTISSSPAPHAPPTARSARSSTWCCGSFVKQLTKSHHFD